MKLFCDALLYKDLTDAKAWNLATLAPLEPPLSFANCNIQVDQQRAKIEIQTQKSM
jgi:hypothetical protein